MKETIRNLWPFLKGRKKTAVLSLVYAFVSAGSRLSIPFLAGRAIDLFTKETFDHSLFSLYLILMGVFVILGAFFRFLFDFSVSWLGESVVKDIRDQAFLSLNRTSLSYLERKGKGELVYNLTGDTENVKNGLFSGVAALYDGVITILMTLGFMLSVHYILAILVVVLTPLSVLVSRLVSKNNSKHFKAQAKGNSNIGKFIKEETANSISTRALGAGAYREEAFEKEAQELRKSNFKAMMSASLVNPSTRLVNNLIYASVILAGAAILITDFDFGMAFTIGGLSSFLTYANSYMAPFNEVADVYGEMGYAAASLKRLTEVIALPNDVDEGKKALEGEIEEVGFDHVHFSYEEGKPIIKDFDLVVYPRHRIALVGPTGCGKTTLINLLLRFYEVEEGKIAINGLPTTEISKENLRKRVSAVLQEPWIFKGTVEENIAYGKKGATHEEVVKAAELSLADSFIKRLSQGYETMIGGESSLSVGEKQLICLARAMVSRPDIVVLDEATSNVDLYTESLLKKGFDSFMEGRTSVVVAHRLSTIMNSDLIVAMKDGRIVEMGNHEELMEKGGFYKNLFEAQFS